MFSVAIIVLFIVLLGLIQIFQPLLILWYKKKYAKFQDPWEKPWEKAAWEVRQKLKNRLKILMGLLILALWAETYILFFKSDFNPSPDPGIKKEIGLINKNLHNINAKLINIHSHPDTIGTTSNSIINDILSSISDQNDRLSDLEETINRISTGSSSENLNFVKRAFLGLIIIGIIGIGLFIIFKHKWIALFSLSSLLGGVALLGIETFKGEFRLFEKTVVNSINNPGLPEEVALSHPSLDSLGAITGFKEGTSDKNYDTIQFCKVVMDIQNRSDIGGLLVIGEVDKRELKDSIKNQFGSNLSLARARAEYIKMKLLEKGLQGNILVITLGRGAYHTNPNDQSAAQNKDRQVVVYALSNKIINRSTHPLAEVE